MDRRDIPRPSRVSVPQALLSREADGSVSVSFPLTSGVIQELPASVADSAGVGTGGLGSLKYLPPNAAEVAVNRRRSAGWVQRPSTIDGRVVARDPSQVPLDTIDSSGVAVLSQGPSNASIAGISRIAQRQLDISGARTGATNAEVAAPLLPPIPYTNFKVDVPDDTPESMPGSVVQQASQHGSMPDLVQDGSSCVLSVFRSPGQFTFFRFVSVEKSVPDYIVPAAGLPAPVEARIVAPMASQGHLPPVQQAVDVPGAFCVHTLSTAAPQDRSGALLTAFLYGAFIDACAAMIGIMSGKLGGVYSVVAVSCAGFLVWCLMTFIYLIGRVRWKAYTRVWRVITLIFQVAGYLLGMASLDFLVEGTVLAHVFPCIYLAMAVAQFVCSIAFLVQICVRPGKDIHRLIPFLCLLVIPFSAPLFNMIWDSNWSTVWAFTAFAPFLLLLRSQITDDTAWPESAVQHDVLLIYLGGICSVVAFLSQRFAQKVGAGKSMVSPH